MYKRIVSLVLLPLALAGCAANQNLPIANFAADGGPAVQETAAASAASPAVDLAVNYSEMNQPTVCQDIRRPGSRIIVERRCYTPDAEPEDTAYQQQMVLQQVERFRREQEEMERAMRERDEAIRRAGIEQAMRNAMRGR
jgi:hypothetical protein